MTIRSLHASQPVHAMIEGPAGWLPWLRRALRAIETRRQLAGMEPRMLADIGISRSEAFEEAARAPWDLAPRWR